MTETATIQGNIPVVTTIWSHKDIWDHIKLRWSIGRTNSIVNPGIYAVGNPSSDSNVFISANYTLSFNHLRRALNGLNAWILVLDTKGINVWCAAGKGTFGTQELVKRLKVHELEKIVTHKNIIVPQLGATGVSAHEVKRDTGFRVIYGPVRAKDIADFIKNEYKATLEMRRVEFPLWERIKLIPVEIVYGKYYLLFVPALFFVLAGIYPQGYSVEIAWAKGGQSAFNLLTAYISGCIITPILLPLIPFKAFSLKGLIVGLISTSILLFYNLLGDNWIEIISWYLILGSLSSFMAINFTGSSTFTSLSGVKKEMKYSLPAQIVSAIAGFGLWVTSRFI